MLPELAPSLSSYSQSPWSAFSFTPLLLVFVQKSVPRKELHRELLLGSATMLPCLLAGLYIHSVSTSSSSTPEVWLFLFVGLFAFFAYVPSGKSCVHFFKKLSVWCDPPSPRSVCPLLYLSPRRLPPLVNSSYLAVAPRPCLARPVVGSGADDPKRVCRLRSDHAEGNQDPPWRPVRHQRRLDRLSCHARGCRHARWQRPGGWVGGWWWAGQVSRKAGVCDNLETDFIT